MEMAVSAKSNSRTLRSIVAFGREREEAFRNAIFDALWQEQKDIADPAVLSEALSRAGGDLTILDQAGDPSVREALTKRTAEAYASGVFRGAYIRLERRNLLWRGSTGRLSLEGGSRCS